MKRYFRAYLRWDWEHLGEKTYEHKDASGAFTTTLANAVVYEAAELPYKIEEWFIIEELPEDEQMRRNGQPALFNEQPAATGAWDWTRGLEEKRPKRRGGNTIR